MDDAEHGYAPVDGTCQDIASFYDINTNSLGSVRVGIGNTDLPPDIMNWWAADNWCKAQGKNLINIAALNLTLAKNDGESYSFTKKRKRKDTL